MAAIINPNSFLLSLSPSTRLTLKNPKSRINAKRAAEDNRTEENEKSSNLNPFAFKFGKVPDVKSLIPMVRESTSNGFLFGNQKKKDPGTVFVAGATGQVGVRIAQTLLREGFSVRAGVPELGSAQELARFAANYKLISNEESKRLNAVESTFQDPESIAKAIGNASKVAVTIGPGENGPTNEVSTSDALQVIEAAQLAGVSHVAIIYNGNTSTASTYNVLDGVSSFFNNLFSRSQPLTVAEFLQKVIETDISYTFIKTSLTEDFSPESGYNVVVSAERSTSAKDYKVAKSQIASLVANVFSNTAVAENKVVEVFTDPSASSKSRPLDQLFSAIPEDGRRKAYAETLAKAKAEEEAVKAAEKAREAAKAAKKLEEFKKLSKQEARATTLAEEAKEKAEAAETSVDSLLTKAKDFSSGLSWPKLRSQLANAVQKPVDEKPKVQMATVRGQAKARTLPAKKAVLVNQTGPKVRSSFLKPKAKEEEEKSKGKQEGKTEIRNVFGGLFKQETFYVDDD